MKKGEAKIEFFSNLVYLKKEYAAGLVVSKFLYNKAVLEKNIKMTYTQFNKYFNDVFVSDTPKINQNSNNINSSNLVEEVKKEVLSNEPIRAKISTKENKVFDALYGKKFNSDDIL